MKFRRAIFVALIFMALAIPAYAAWCSGGDGSTWFIECTNSGCTITAQDKQGNWVYIDGPRAWGDELCN
jgi:hypothetical protein